jgi:cardiolipin synthase
MAAMAWLGDVAGTWWRWFDLATTVLALLTVPSVLVQRLGRPMAAISWILCLVTLPPLGLVLWWVLGRRHLERRRRRKLTARAAMAPKLSSLRERLDPPPSAAPVLLPLHRLPDELSHSVPRPTRGNAVRLLTSKEAFAVMEHDIEAAEHHVHALFYIWKNDTTGRRFRDLLIRKARQGLEVRVLCDAVGSPVMGSSFSRPLRRAGAKVARFLPPQLFSLPRINFRNHRKILVVDGAAGTIGGFNIADEYRKRWRDAGARLSGPAVDQLQEIFADDWFYATGEDLADPTYFGRWRGASRSERDAGAGDSALSADDDASCAIIASGPDTVYSPMHDALFVAITETRERLFITTPYFVPSYAILVALRAAVFRGVDVRIMVPARVDVPFVHAAARSYYPELLGAGVRIFEYRPTMLHAKTMVFDRALTMIGSANLDSRSFRLNFEASCFIASERLNGELCARFESDQEQCGEVSADALSRRPWGAKLFDATAHLLSPLL